MQALGFERTGQVSFRGWSEIMQNPLLAPRNEDIVETQCCSVFAGESSETRVA